MRSFLVDIDHEIDQMCVTTDEHVRSRHTVTVNWGPARRFPDTGGSEDVIGGLLLAVSPLVDAAGTEAMSNSLPPTNQVDLG